MGRAAVRTAVTNYLTGLNVPYVGTVFPARPTIADEQAYEQTMSGQAVQASANGSACVIVVNMPTDVRTRKADTGRGAVNDWDVHSIALELFFACTGGDAVAAQNDYDSIVDAIVVAIRDDPLLGAPQTVWSAGEFNAGVKHAQAQPETPDDGLTVLINGVIRFDTYEWVSGTGV